MKFRLLIDFETQDELIDFIIATSQSEKAHKNLRKATVKKPDDKRGSKTTELHQKAKNYKLSHPDVPYRQCLIRVSNPINQIQTEIHLPTEDDENNLKDILINVDNSI